MNRSVKNFIEVCSISLPINEPIYEFGSRQMPGQEGYANLRGYFKNKSYVGADYIEGPGVDVVLDLHDLDLQSESVGTLICMEVLEHVERPFDALKEMYRVLKPGGLLIISAPMKLPIHGSPFDYWRFTPEGFKTLLKPFGQSFVGYCGDVEFPDTVVGVAVKEGQISLVEFERQYTKWQRRWSSPFPPIRRKILSTIEPVIPPIFVGSSFELWRRQITNPNYSAWKGAIKLILPPVIKSFIIKKNAK